MVAAGTAVIVIFVQLVTRLPFSVFKSKRFYIYRVKFNCLSEDNEEEQIKNIFGITMFSRINYNHTGESINAVAEISTSHIMNDTEIKRVVFDNDFITAIERIYQFDAKE